jgi:hypothetical protein
MTKLMRNDAEGEAEGMADLMQVITELTNQRFFAAWTGQEPSIRRQRIQGTKECQALDKFPDKGIDGDHTFGFELAERHMNRPLIRTGGTKAVAGQIGALADAHAGVANQQKNIAPQIIAVKELLLEELILLGGERPWKPLRWTWNVLAANQTSEFSQRFGPS